MNTRKTGGCNTKADVTRGGMHVRWELGEWEQSQSVSSVLWNTTDFTHHRDLNVFGVMKDKQRSSLCSEYQKEHGTPEKMDIWSLVSQGESFSWNSANQYHCVLLWVEHTMPNVPFLTGLFTSWQHFPGLWGPTSPFFFSGLCKDPQEAVAFYGKGP